MSSKLSDSQQTLIGPRRINQSRKQVFIVAITCLLSLCSLFSYRLQLWRTTVQDFEHLRSYCDGVSSITAEEFRFRQTTLVRFLRDSNASAYIAEPGANTQYFGNFSTANWRLSERPLLLIIAPTDPPGAPHASGDEEEPEVQITVLTPKFEATRAKLLPIPLLAKVRYVEWAEESNPYEHALSALYSYKSWQSSDSSSIGLTNQTFDVSAPFERPTIFVDNSIRKFIADGLQNAGATVLSAPPAITQLRERKSSAELDILRCVNEVTLLAIRAVHQQMYIGMRESEARGMMSTTLAAAGLQDGGCLTLFGENAALPHGSGTDCTLGPSDFALFDCTASLKGYFSDVTRTVSLPASSIPLEHQKIWNVVHAAQATGLRSARQGIRTGAVDEYVRGMISSLGYPGYFTHRLGHGIGLEVHETPYLRGGATEIIQTGNTFSDEPGIYIEGKVGVRLEDCFYIDHAGNAVLLTAGVGGQSRGSLYP